MSTTGKKFADVPSLDSPSRIIGVASDGSVGKVPMSAFMAYNGRVSDLDDAWGQPGLYQPNTGCLNYPAGVTPNPSDAILCLSGTVYGIQVLMAMNTTNIIYVRVRTGTSYNGWIHATMTT